MKIMVETLRKKPERSPKGQKPSIFRPRWHWQATSMALPLRRAKGARPRGRALSDCDVHRSRGAWRLRG